MKLIKRLKHTAEKDRYSTELDILIYEKNIIWYFIEQTKFEEGEEFTEDQSYDDYIKNGPPAFAADLPSEIIQEISLQLTGKNPAENDF
jgi:hypothetical protein